jgi:phosphoribosylaminoimidazolecarboxamide formyltransferase / IMP cyclohydrolase
MVCTKEKGGSLLTNFVPIRSALISVFDKTGLKDLALALTERGVVVYSTGGTYRYLSDELGIQARKVEALTGFPEMMDGRVKTLHPKVFGGILARREEPQDLVDAASQAIPLFDLVVVNLYDFGSTRGQSKDQQVKLIDIGGPAMLRAAAKNHASVTVLSSPNDYAGFLCEYQANVGKVGAEFRSSCALRTFERTSTYDAEIVSEWSKSAFPQSVSLSPQTELRYGENPHQKAVWSGDPKMWKVLQGKELSYNNLLDAESAVRCSTDFGDPVVVIVKHGNPCGVASGPQPTAALFTRAFQSDSKSAFGGIVACNRPIDLAAAEAMSEVFLEVIAAPSFSAEALRLFSEKKSLRLVELTCVPKPSVEIRPALGGWLLQTSDFAAPQTEWKTVTKAQVPEALIADLHFAWTVCKHVRSNAITIAKDCTTKGIGAGQTNRVDSVAIALQKIESTRGCVLASDAFFPFRDGIDLLKGRGIAAVIQPGGSKRDPEVIAACDELGIPMVFTGTRHFRH